MFPEYSHSKRFSITPDIVEFDDPKLAPPFDLIIGTATMEDLGIVLDFETKMIAIDGMNLPMRNIKNLQVPGTRFQIWKNSWFVEPIVTVARPRALKQVIFERGDRKATKFVAFENPLLGCGRAGTNG